MDQQTQPLICPSHTTQYIAAVIVGILIGAGASFVYLKQTSQSGFDDVKKRVLESQMGLAFRTPDDVRTISGAVTKVEGSRFTIHTPSINPFDEPTLLDRTVIITASTKITKISQGDMKAFQAEMDAFVKNTQAGKGAGMIPPRPPEQTITTVPASSIIVGSTLTATATENIKTMKEFTASEIQIQ